MSRIQKLPTVLLWSSLARLLLLFLLSMMEMSERSEVLVTRQSKDERDLFLWKLDCWFYIRENHIL